jgi:hypothetical protein
MNKKAAGGLAGIVLVSAMLTAVTTIPAHAASVACGSTCLALTSEGFGTGYVSAVVPPANAVLGQHVNLGPAGPFLREDWEFDYLGTAKELAADGIIPLANGKAWPNALAYQYVYSPGGDQSASLCLGITSGTIAEDGSPVSLQTCGVTAVTIWLSFTAPMSSAFSPLINGTNVLDGNPYVLTASATFHQLITDRLVVRPGKGPAPSQLWRNLFGVL